MKLLCSILDKIHIKERSKSLQKTLIIIFGLIAMIMIAFAIRAVISRSLDAVGILDSKLTPCPQTKNCVCSEFPTDTTHHIEPLSIATESVEKAMQNIREIVIEIGGKVTSSNSTYLSATTTSTVFRFIDDIEFRLDEANKVIHIRSASRVGRSDFGANRKRVEKIRQLWTTLD
jgi:uncharacterized protein (DUF1499 family)